MPRWRLGSDKHKDLKTEPLTVTCVSACSLNDEDWKWWRMVAHSAAKALRRWAGARTIYASRPDCAAPPRLRRCPHCTGACPRGSWGERLSSRDAEVGRALRSEHARARSAYPRDPLSLRSTQHTRLSHPAASPRVHITGRICSTLSHGALLA